MIMVHGKTLVLYILCQVSIKIVKTLIQLGEDPSLKGQGWGKYEY